MKWIKICTVDGIPVYRVMDRLGKVIDPSQDPQVSRSLMSTSGLSRFNGLMLARIDSCLKRRSSECTSA